MNVSLLADRELAAVFQRPLSLFVPNAFLDGIYYFPLVKRVR